MRVSLTLKHSQAKPIRSWAERTGTGLAVLALTMATRIEGLVVDSTSEVTTLYYDGKPNVTITVPGDIWGKWANPDGIPSYILQHLHSTRKDSRLHVREDDLGIPGQSFIILRHYSQGQASSFSGFIILRLHHSQSFSGNLRHYRIRILSTRIIREPLVPCAACMCSRQIRSATS